MAATKDSTDVHLTFTDAVGTNYQKCVIKVTLDIPYSRGKEIRWYLWFEISSTNGNKAI
jgi:hypothetical protein